ncbi:hypothetical protein [Maricaulis sp.]|uniref:hypothetical protein n=1 Tax=Maricaulis sp. TaxID=1486257 RepID=UPI0026197194|nr:hypothetical protein [Maricaulis sp.]
MHRFSILIGAAAMIAATGLTPGADAELRFQLRAHVAERCAIAEIDAEAWEEGVLRLQTHCNAEHFSVRLLQGDNEIALRDVQATGAADARLRAGQIRVRQTRPGTLQLAVEVEDPFALTRGALSVRIEAA